jgi:DNA polymerase I
LQAKTLDLYINKQKTIKEEETTKGEIARALLPKDEVEKIPDIKEVNEGGPFYLLSVDYDGQRGKAYCKLYDPVSEEILVYYDKTSHLPYFIVDIDPDKVKQTKIVNNPAFHGMEVIYKKDPFTKKKKRLTKIIVKDPLSVRGMREHVPKAYEAHIKYHNNYIYDNQLIVGIPYRLKSGQLIIEKLNLPEKELNEILSVFAREHEIVIDLAKEWIPIFEFPIPKIKKAAVDIEVFTPVKGLIPDPEEADFPVISASIVDSNGKKEVLLLRWKEEIVNNSDIRIEIFNNERDLIRSLLLKMFNYPIILTFNGDDFDLPYLYHRALKLGLEKEASVLQYMQEKWTLRTGIHIDLYQFFSNKAIRNYAFDGKYSEYTLDAVSRALINESKIKLDKPISSLTLSSLVEYNLKDAEITLKLVQDKDELVWKLIVLLSRISRMSIEELTRTEVSTWIKNLYYWEHRRQNILIPLKEDLAQLIGSSPKTTAIIKGKKYAGAIVIDPPSGVFFNVVVLDFASLYPSIIKNWNLSYETVDNLECKNKKPILDEKENILHYTCMDEPGIMAVVTGLMRDFRVKIYKKKSKIKELKQEQRDLYDVVQKAMKVFINATYGVLGSDNFPLYAPAVAESVTATGRYIISNTYKFAKENGLNVLYGDTDSLFIHNPSKEQIEKLIRWVEETYRLDIEVDKVFRYVTFSGLKKNYLGVKEDGNVEVKGLLAKKRNTPEFIRKEFGEVKQLLAQVVNEEDFIKIKKKVIDKVKNIYSSLRSKKYDLDELAFKVMLSKPIESYRKNLPQHVKAAIKLKEQGIPVSARDIIYFVKVTGKDGVKPVQLAKLSEIDTDKYMETVRSTFEQLLSALDVSWEEINKISRLDGFNLSNN